MSHLERQPEIHQEPDPDASATEWSDSPAVADLHLRPGGPFIRELVPGIQREIDRALERAIFLLAEISRDQEALESVRPGLGQSLDLLTEQILDVT